MQSMNPFENMEMLEGLGNVPMGDVPRPVINPRLFLDEEEIRRQPPEYRIGQRRS